MTEGMRRLNYFQRRYAAGLTKIRSIKFDWAPPDPARAPARHDSVTGQVPGPERQVQAPVADR